MLRTPPDILITTPESLYLHAHLAGARELLRRSQWSSSTRSTRVAQTKRGAHLALTLERLAEQAGRDAAAHRPLRHPAAARGGGAASSSGRRASAASPTPAVRKPLDLRIHVPVESMVEPRRHARAGPLPGGGEADAPQHLAGHLPELLEARPRAPLDARLRQQPPRRRAHRASGSTTSPRSTRRRRGEGSGDRRAHHGSLAREERVEHRGPAQVGAAALPGRHLVAGARHRHGRRRPRGPGGVAQVGHARPAARRPRRPRRGRGVARARSSPSSAPTCSSAPSSRGACARASSRPPWCRATRSTCWRSRSSPSRRRRGRGRDGGRAPRPRPAHVHLRRARAAPARERAGHAGRPLPLGRSSRELRPRIVWDRVAGTVRARAGARSLAVANAGTIPDRGLFSVNLAGRPPGRRAGRGDGLRGARRSDFPARRDLLAHRADHA